MKTMTINQLAKLFSKTPYALLRCTNGKVIGINGKISEIALKRKFYNPNQKTIYIGFIPCSINEYINYKLPFIIKYPNLSKIVK